MIKAILFDWDLTLGRPLGNVPFSSRLKAVLDKNGLHHRAGDIQQALATRDLYIQNGEWEGKLQPQNKTDLIVFYQQVLLLLGERHVSEGMADELRQSYVELPFVFYADTMPVLRKLAGLGYQLGIITNNSIRVRKVILSKVVKYIPDNAITISDEVHIYKPDGEIFILGAHRLGVEPEECIYVGDNLLVDAIAALTNGRYLRSYWLNRSRSHPNIELPEGVCQIFGLSELVPI